MAEFIAEFFPYDPDAVSTARSPSSHVIVVDVLYVPPFTSSTGAVTGRRYFTVNDSTGDAVIAAAARRDLYGIIPRFQLLFAGAYCIVSFQRLRRLPGVRIHKAHR
ncbi:MAG: hypothetical protein ACLTXT_02340 [Ruminococcus callidus]